MNEKCWTELDLGEKPDEYSISASFFKKQWSIDNSYKATFQTVLCLIQVP